MSAPRAMRRAAILLLLGSLPLGCAREREAALPPIVLVTLDTVRADHLGLYGYPKRTSPALDAFARSADVYETAWATAPWTVPSHASMFTGLAPSAHGAHSFDSEERRGNVRPLATEHVTVSEFLQGRGYRTGAFVANRAFLTSRLQFDQGFDSYVVEQLNGMALNERIASWLREVSGEPFFLFVNYMDAHRPYNTSSVPGLPPAPGGDPGQMLTRLAEQVMGDEPEEPGLVDLVVAQYDVGVANADRALGDLADRLRALGVFDDALVIVVSDHGEYFGEHRIVEHSKDVYEPAMRVPLIVKRPGQARGRRVPEPISVADVPGLVLAALPGDGSDAPPPFRAPVHSRPILAENHFTRAKDLSKPWGRRFWRIRSVLYEWPYKYIRSSDGKDELYDLGSDAGEQRDLGSTEAARAERMRTALDRLVPVSDGVGPPGAELDLTPEEIEALRELGYAD